MKKKMREKEKKNFICDPIDFAIYIYTYRIQNQGIKNQMQIININFFIFIFKVREEKLIDSS